MKYYEWLNKEVGDYDIFLVAQKNDTERIVQHFGTELARGCKSNIAEEWYYFLNTKDKIITPMPLLSFAFGGQYNDSLPFGKEIIQFSFNIEEYSFQIHNLSLIP